MPSSRSPVLRDCHVRSSANAGNGYPGKAAGPPSLPEWMSSDVAAIRREIRVFLRRTDPKGRMIGSAKCGVYAVYDYDGQPIYIGQSFEGRGPASVGTSPISARTPLP